MTDYDLKALEMERCHICDLQGILRLRVTGTDEETLAYCGCDWSSTKHMPAMTWKLPEVNRRMVSAFEIEACPREWFMPKNKRASIPRGSLLASIAPIIERWIARVRAAESFWREHGGTFGAQVRGDDGGAA